VEFKVSSYREAIETISAFTNTRGGTDQGYLRRKGSRRCGGCGVVKEPRKRQLCMAGKQDNMNIRSADDEWREWYRLTPADRWRETKKLWDFFLVIGGSLGPEPDSQSPFRDAFEPGALSAHGRTGMRILRHGGN